MFVRKKITFADTGNFNKTTRAITSANPDELSKETVQMPISTDLCATALQNGIPDAIGPGSAGINSNRRFIDSSKTQDCQTQPKLVDSTVIEGIQLSDIRVPDIQPQINTERLGTPVNRLAGSLNIDNPSPAVIEQPLQPIAAADILAQVNSGPQPIDPSEIIATGEMITPAAVSPTQTNPELVRQAVCLATESPDITRKVQQRIKVIPPEQLVDSGKIPADYTILQNRISAGFIPYDDIKPEAITQNNISQAANTTEPNQLQQDELQENIKTSTPVTGKDYDDALKYLIGVTAVTGYTLGGASIVGSQFVPEHLPNIPILNNTNRQTEILADQVQIQTPILEQATNSIQPLTKQEVLQDQAIQEDIQTLNEAMRSFGYKAVAVGDMATCAFNIALASKIGQPGMALWGALAATISGALGLIDPNNKFLNEELQADKILIGPLQEAGVGNNERNREILNHINAAASTNPELFAGEKIELSNLDNIDPSKAGITEQFRHHDLKFLPNPDIARDIVKQVQGDSEARERVKQELSEVGDTCKFVLEDQVQVFESLKGFFEQSYNYIKNPKQNPVPDALNIFDQEQRETQKKTMAGLCALSAGHKIFSLLGESINKNLAGLTLGFTQLGNTPVLMMMSNGSKVASNVIFGMSQAVGSGSLYTIANSEGVGKIPKAALLACIPLRMALCPAVGVTSHIGYGALEASIGLEYMYFLSLMKDGPEALKKVLQNSPQEFTRLFKMMAGNNNSLISDSEIAENPVSAPKLPNEVKRNLRQVKKIKL